MNGIRVRWLLVVGAAVVLCGTKSALAWGPAKHVYLADQLLSEAGLLSAGLAALLLKHRGPFLYGNIAQGLSSRWLAGNMAPACAPTTCLPSARSFVA
jgi:hypothetical protein